MSDYITVNNTIINLSTKPTLLFGVKTADPKHCFVDPVTEEIFFGVPPNIEQSAKTWDAFAEFDHYECSNCRVNIFENTLCSLKGLDKIEADQYHFYCNEHCQERRVSLELDFQGNPVGIYNAAGGVEIFQVLEAVAHSYDVSIDTLTVGDFDHDDCIGHLVNSDVRTIKIREVREPEAPAGFQAFGRYCGTAEDPSNKLFLDELTKNTVVRAFEPTVAFLHDFMTNDDLPAIVGKINMGMFYLDATRQNLHFFKADDVEYEFGCDKYPLCEQILRYLMSKRAEKHIEKDPIWRPYYVAYKEVKCAKEGIFGANPNALRKLLKRSKPVVIVLEDEPEPVAIAPQPVAIAPQPVAIAPQPVAIAPQPVAIELVPVDSHYRLYTVGAASGLVKITKSSRPMADKWFSAYRKMTDLYYSNSSDMRVPVGEVAQKHVVLEDGNIRFSKKVQFVNGTLLEKRNFMCQIAEWMTHSWKGKSWLREQPVFAKFKVCVEKKRQDQWLVRQSERIQGLREEVVNLMSTVATEEILGQIIEFLKVSPNEENEFEVDPEHLDRFQLREMHRLLTGEQEEEEEEAPKIVEPQSKPSNFEELAALAQQTAKNTDAALQSLKDELATMSGKVTSSDHPTKAADGVDYVSKFTLNEEALKKQVEAEYELDSSSDTDGGEEEENQVSPAVRQREEQEEEQEFVPQKRARSVPLLDREVRDRLHGNNEVTYASLRELFPNDEDRNDRHEMMQFYSTKH